MIITDLDIDDYHSRGEVSKSQLDTLDLSPAIFEALRGDAESIGSHFYKHIKRFLYVWIEKMPAPVGQPQ